VKMLFCLVSMKQNVFFVDNLRSLAAKATPPPPPSLPPLSFALTARIVRSRQWCEMAPCLEGEVCSYLFNRSGWTCTRGSGRIKTVTVIYTTWRLYLYTPRALNSITNALTGGNGEEDMELSWPHIAPFC